jgi:DinB family protein
MSPTIAEDRSYIDANNRERERLRALVEALDDDALNTPVNEYWTVAGVLGHIAFWDVRVLVFADKIDRGEPWVPSDDEPEGDWLNDSTRPRIHAIAPRAAAELSPVYAVRADHRGEHLDQIEAALKARGRKG